MNKNHRRASMSKAPSTRSAMADEEKLVPGHWMGSLLYVLFNTLLLLIG